MNLKNKKVTVMGIGLHGGGVAMIEWLVKQGARVIATDKKPAVELKKSIEKIERLKNVTIITGQHRTEDFTHVDLVIKNPTVKWSNKYIKIAQEKGIPVEMDSSLFMKLCPSNKIIGITGTKGKTTTSLIIAHILEEAGMDVVKVGIGQEAVMNKLSKIKKDSWVIFELSSWRLSIFKKAQKSLKIAVITNIFPDHLNYYKSMNEYVLDKKNIFKLQQDDNTIVLNGDQVEYLDDFLAEARSETMVFSRESIENKDEIYINKGDVVCVKRGERDTLFQTKDIALRGEHNFLNILAASAVAKIVGVSARDIRNAVSTFSGVRHRLEYVGKSEGVAYYNDTAATTPEAAIAGIEAFSRPIHLICGGSNKDLDLHSLAQKIAKTDNINSVLLLKGGATETLLKILREFDNAADKVVGLYDSVDKAVRDLHVRAKEGEVALLSPGCASFGMFANEFERGDKFKEAVKGLSEK